MRILALLAALLLAGCAGLHPLTTVRVPVQVECKQQVPQRPEMPTEAFTRKPGVDQLLQASLAEIERREGYEIEMRAALEACTKPISPP